MAIQIRDELEMTDNLWETVEFPRQNVLSKTLIQYFEISDFLLYMYLCI